MTNDHKRRIYFNIFRLFFSIPDLLRKKEFLNPNGSKEPYAFVIYSAYWVKIHYHFRSVDLKIPPKIKEYLECMFYRVTYNNLDVLYSVRWSSEKFQNFRTTSMLVTDVGDEMCWRQLWDACDGFRRFLHQYPLSFNISVGNQQPKDVTNIEILFIYNIFVKNFKNYM